MVNRDCLSGRESYMYNAGMTCRVHLRAIIIHAGYVKE